MLAGALAPEARADADSLWEAWRERWSATSTYSAHFSQSIEISGTGTVLESSGRFYFSRPDLMRWDYLEGTRQTVVADGSFVWLYQPELEQVYRLAYSEAFGKAGLMALLVAGEELRARYQLTATEVRAGLLRLRLVPYRGEEPSLDLMVDADSFELSSIVVTDPAGSLVTMEFSETLRDGPLERALFSYTPAEGIDVITD